MSKQTRRHTNKNKNKNKNKKLRSQSRSQRGGARGKYDNDPHLRMAYRYASERNARGAYETMEVYLKNHSHHNQHADYKKIKDYSETLKQSYQMIVHACDQFTNFMDGDFASDSSRSRSISSRSSSSSESSSRSSSDSD